MDKLLREALAVERERKRVDFKSSFNVQSNGEWCELIKDLVAMANSGGGVVVVLAESVEHGLEGDEGRRRRVARAGSGEQRLAVGVG